MKKLLSFNEFINESIVDVIGSPVKYTKIKNNAKKYQKALVQKALNDIDYEKKKAAAKKDPDTQVGVVTAAKKAKDQALSDVVSATSDRIDSLATTAPLKTVSSLAKNKAKIAAAKTSLKAADSEETKQLNLKIKNLEQKAKDDTQELKDYESDSDKVVNKSKTSNDSDNKQKNSSNDSSDMSNSELDPTVALEKDIADFDKNIEAEMTTVAKLKKDLDQAKRDASTGRGSDAETLKIQKRLDDSNEDLSELKKRKAGAKKKLDSLQKESAGYIGESVADKFRRVMNTRV